MDTFRKKWLYKVKMPKKCKKICLNLLDKINFHQCELTTTHMKNNKNFRSQLSTAVLTSTITHSAKYRLIIVIDKIPVNSKMAMPRISIITIMVFLITTEIYDLC